MKSLFDRLQQPFSSWSVGLDADGSRRSRSLTDSRSILLALAPLGAIAAWMVSLRSIPLHEMSDLGLVSVLPLTFYAAIGLLTFGFMLGLRTRPLPRVVLAIDTVALIVILYGTLPIVADELSFATAWLHTGFADVVGRTGELYQGRDARFSWPAFFALGGYLTQGGGLPHPIDIAPWAPLVLNLLFFGPLLVIFRSATTDPRLIWLSIWIFYSVNWVGQDYFSPQGFAFLLYLTIFAVILSAYRAPGGRLGWIEWLQHRLRAIRQNERGGVPDSEGLEATAPLEPRARAGLVVVAVILFVTVTAGHQLTPFAAIGSVVALVLFGRTTLRGLPLIMIVVLTTWLSYMTVTFLAGHLAGLLEDLGRTENVAASNVANRIRGSFEHQLVVYARLAFTGVVWLLAFIGGTRRLFERHIELTMGLLALAPFGLIALQGYGGEMLLRVFLFSSPFMAFLAAAALVPYRGRVTASWVRTGALVVVGLALIGGFLLTRFGNASADYMSSAEVSAAERMYGMAASGALLATVNHNAPLLHVRWEAFRYATLRDEVLTGDIDDVIVALEEADATEAYLFLSRSQRAFAQLFQGLRPETWDRVLSELQASPSLEITYENADAIVFRLRAGGTAGP